MNRLFLKLSCAIFLVANSAYSQSLLKNGDFQDWTKGLPDHWSVDIGAKNGSSGIQSLVQQGDDKSLQLSGDQKTNDWSFVSQSIDVLPNQTFQLKIVAKTENVRREGNQHNNCYVGMIQKDREGKSLAFDVIHFDSKTYKMRRKFTNTKQYVVKLTVGVFLSKSGKLNVQSIVLRRFHEKDSFQMLVEDMDENYSFFAHKKMDWKKLSRKYYASISDGYSFPRAFRSSLKPMLMQLRDPHIWIMEGSKRMPTYTVKWLPNYDFEIVDKSLDSKKSFGNLGIVGKTKDGFGYVRVTSLYKIKLTSLNDMIGAIEELKGAKGIIVDLRRNNGGSENTAMMLAGLFAQKKVMYAKQLRRNGSAHTDLALSGTRYIGPTGKEIYRKPFVCLLGPGAVSSGEGMAMMFHAMDHCTTIGQATRGSSGNPAPVKLPNGVEVWYSRWVSQLPDGTTIEGVGVQPQIKVEHKKGSDKTFEKAVAVLKAKLSAVD